jgi:predicted O-methyltransferase YrrM
MADAIVSIQPALMAGLPELDSTATDWESLTLLYGLALYLRPKVIVEAGTYQGHFAVVVARLLPECAVWTADPQSRLGEGAEPNLHFVRADFDAMLADQPDLRGQVDFAFIDSGPPWAAEEPEMRWRHWTSCKAFMRSGGIMACHDTNAATTWPRGTDIARESLRLNGGRGVCLWQAP